MLSNVSLPFSFWEDAKIIQSSLFNCCFYIEKCSIEKITILHTNITNLVIDFVKLKDKIVIFNTT